MLFVNDDRTVGFGADVQEGGDFVVEKLHPGEYTIQVRADEEGYLVEEVRDPSGALRWFTVPEVGDGFAEIDLTRLGVSRVWSETVGTGARCMVHRWSYSARRGRGWQVQ